MTKHKNPETHSNNDSDSNDTNPQQYNTQQQSENNIFSYIPSLNINKSVGIVGVSEGISYGIGLMVYFILLSIITGLVAALGFVFFIGSGGVDNVVVTGVLGLVGVIVYMVAFAIFFAGFAGLQYKIITDAVARALKSLS